MSHKGNIRTFYSLFHARWYDPFRKFWTTVFSHKTENLFYAALRIHLKPSSNILEIGCGTGYNIERIKKMTFRSYKGLDLTPDMLNIAKSKYGHLKKFSFSLQDVTKMCSSKKYDTIICTWVLSHIYNPDKFVNHLNSMLKKDGRIFSIFLTRPNWLLYTLLYPVFRLCATRFVFEESIKKFKGVIKRKSFLTGMATFMEIKKV